MMRLNNLTARILYHCQILDAAIVNGYKRICGGSVVNDWVRRYSFRTNNERPPLSPSSSYLLIPWLRRAGRYSRRVNRTANDISRRFSFTRSNTTIDDTPLNLLKQIHKSLCQKKDSIAPNLSVSSSSSSTSDLFVIGTTNSPNNESSADLCTAVGIFGRLYRQLPHIQLNSTDSCQRTQILKFLAVECSMDPSRVITAVKLLEKASNHSESPDTIPFAAYTRIQDSCSAEYEDLFRLLLQDHAADGLKCVLDIREDLLRLIPCLASKDEQQTKLLTQLKRLDNSLQQLLSSWMVPGLIQFLRLTYEDTSACVLERIVKNEAVHPVTSLEDLRKRLGPGRRVFALFHPCLPSTKPLNVLYVALVKNDIPTSMDEIHSINRGNFAEQPTIATFYSISSLRPGLSGIGMAELLIHSAVEHIQATVPSVEIFCTLSPLPKFREWLTVRINRSGASWGTLFPAPSKSVVSNVRDIIGKDETSATPAMFTTALNFLGDTSQNSDNNSTNSLQLQEALRPWLMECAAHYLAREKHRRKPFDPVARFHVGNGAILDRLHWKADTSRKGWLNSWGIMVTYRYDLGKLSENRFNYHNNVSSSNTIEIPLGADVERYLSSHKEQL